MNIHSLPKIELHCHLDGSVQPETLYELAKDIQYDLPEGGYEAFLPLVRVPTDCKSLVEYLNRFTLPIAVMQTKEALVRIATELIEEVSKQNVKYIEVRFAPHLHLLKGLSFDEVVESVLTGLEEGTKRTGTHSNLILCCMRHLPLSTSIEVVEKGKKFLGKGVVAVDLAGDEHNFPPELHQEAFDLAKSYGYRITIHAGETGIGANVEKSINLLHAERIGHGLFIKDHEPSYNLVKSNKIALEMCPTSNLQTKAIESYGDHPLLTFLKDGIMATINTDNMTVSNIDLDREYSLVSNELHANASQLKVSYLNSVDSSFASESLKSHLKSFVDAFDL